jgi:O-antigen ligase
MPVFRQPLRRESMVAWSCGIVMVLAIVLGGGTHAGFLGDVIVQLASIPLLALSLWCAFSTSGKGAASKRPLIMAGCVGIVLIVIQLLPLPFAVRSIGDAGNGLALAFEGTSPTWAPLSLSPQATWAAVASFVVPAAIFLAAACLTLSQRFMVVWAVLVLGAFSLFLGLLQAAKGPTGIRFYEVTNANEAVGFFANRNHFAAFLVVTLILGAIWHVRAARKLLASGALNSHALLRLAAAAAFLISVVAGLAMTRSRAGVVLSMAALLGILALILRQRSQHERRGRQSLTIGRLSIATVVFAALFAAQFGLGGILSRFGSDPLDDIRAPIAKTTAEAALQFLPFGAGFGSFVPVYATVEKDKDVSAGYANRAHNDLAEVVLEAGVLSIALILAFLAWFAPRAYKVWRQSTPLDQAQLNLQRAASLIVLLLLAHSLVDYPLRTTALSAIFAFFCAVLATDAADIEEETVQSNPRGFGERKPMLHAAAGEKWGAELQWPQDWQRKE